MKNAVVGLSLLLASVDGICGGSIGGGTGMIQIRIPKADYLAILEAADTPVYVFGKLGWVDKQSYHTGKVNLMGNQKLLINIPELDQVLTVEPETDPETVCE